MPGKDCPHMDLQVTAEGINVPPSTTARNLGMVLDNQLCCTADITAVARSCRFDLYNIHRIRPFLTREAAQLLVQALVVSHLEYCNSLLAGLPLSHVTPLFRDLHWLPVAAHIRFKTMLMAYKALQYVQNSADRVLTRTEPCTSPQPCNNSTDSLSSYSRTNYSTVWLLHTSLTFSLPIPLTFSLPIPLTFSLPIPLTFSLPIPLTFSLPIPLTFSIPIPLTFPLPIPLLSLSQKKALLNQMYYYYYYYYYYY
ncbi:hypothetical protein N1851_015793 [Merluccius polli]|uniref:Uncharacterized protein n=1 Tax=Merluccius polli TaxID=89951 RepID=A0AA47MRK8_MERPO|nr:hypothetical protein N1851_015793 [Merluccius polli]